MSEQHKNADPMSIVERLRDATNAHDLDGIVACFSPGYRNCTPLHPARDFVGKDQVRRNWTQILDAIPDVVTDILSSVADGATVWSEWEHRGRRSDGSAHLMRGVIIFEVDGNSITAARFYLEAVDSDHRGIDDAVRSQVLPEAS